LLSASFNQLIIGRLIVKILSLLTGLALVAFGVTADAHAHLQKSSPVDNSAIATPPSNLLLNFSEAARLTALSIQKDSESPQNLKPLPTTAAQQISVPLPPLTPGAYSVSWRVLSDDGHVMAGTLHFTLTAEGAGAADHPADHSAQH
jgi:methionine-rich copper-binding protein CopC